MKDDEDDERSPREPFAICVIGAQQKWGEALEKIKGTAKRLRKDTRSYKIKKRSADKDKDEIFESSKIEIEEEHTVLKVWRRPGCCVSAVVFTQL